MRGHALLRTVTAKYRTFAALLVATWFTAAPVRTASGEECATIVPPRQMTWERLRLATRAEQPAARAADSTCPWYVPLYIHIVRQDDGSDGLDVADLELSLMQANELYNEHGIHVFQLGAIDYIDDSGFAFLDGCGEDDDLRQVNSLSNAINIYFVPSFTERRCMPLDASTIGECCEGGDECPEGWACILDAEENCGRSSFSQSGGPQGVIVCNAGATNGSTLAHEVGHYFDLYHTHDTGSGVECPDGSNCDAAGDLVCDTPADPNLSGHTVDCLYDDYADPPDSCDDTAYDPDPSNVMSYASKPCRNSFTDGQITRFFESWEMVRSDLFGRTWYVATGAGTEQDGTPLLPFDEVGEAVEAAGSGDHLFIKSGDYSEIMLIDIPMTIRRWDTSGSVVIGAS